MENCTTKKIENNNTANIYSHRGTKEKGGDLFKNLLTDHIHAAAVETMKGYFTHNFCVFSGKTETGCKGYQRKNNERTEKKR